MIWFTSDLHLGHAKVLDFAGRPWDTIDEMNDALIANINARVASTAPRTSSAMAQMALWSSARSLSFAMVCSPLLLILVGLGSLDPFVDNRRHGGVALGRHGLKGDLVIKGYGQMERGSFLSIWHPRPPLVRWSFVQLSNLEKAEATAYPANGRRDPYSV